MSEKIKTAVMEVIKAHMEGENKNTKAVLSDVMKSVNELETLSQEPTDDKCHYCEHNFTPYKGNTGEFTEQEPCTDAVSRGVFEQVMWERDIAIEQLHELGYEFGQKIEPCDDVISQKENSL